MNQQNPSPRATNPLLRTTGKILLSCAILYSMSLSACSKSSDSSSSAESFTTIEGDVINNFVNNTALPQYNSLFATATTLNANIDTLSNNPTDANLATARTNWRAMRSVWERCEGFLLGPVESYDYDPNSDTWPTDYHQMDSLLASSNPLTVTDVQNLPQTLRGYHPIEYLIFGVGGTRMVSQLDTRKKQYLVSLAADLLNNDATPLLLSWTSAPVNYGQAILTAGAGNTVYSSRQAFFLDVVGDNGMAGICNEVGEQDQAGKIYNPYITRDSTLSESPYSGNSLADFKNNIIGLQQVYMGLNGGKGIKDLVAAKNKSLDNQIQTAIASAVSSFDNISGANNERFEEAIFDRRTQIQTTMTQLNTLQSLLANDLTNFITQYVKD
jgi:putative iron-regulated protein